MPVTQQDIANTVGVSKQLVGYALNGNGRIGDATRRKVLREAKRLGYRPNKAARALKSGRTHLVAVWVPHIETAYCARVLHTLETVLRADGHEMIVLSGNKTDAPILEWPVDGLIALDPAISVRAALAGKIKTPATVVIGSYGDGALNKSRGARFDWVHIDKRQASRCAIEQLIEAGCKRVALFAEAAIFDEEEDRYVQYLQAMDEARRTPELIVMPDVRPHRDSAHQALREYSAKRGVPDGLFCGNDDVAIGAYRALRELKKRVPHDVKVIGCDGIPDAADVTPALSTIADPIEDACRVAWTMLQNRRDQADLPPQHQEFLSQLILRDSSR